MKQNIEVIGVSLGKKICNFGPRNSYRNKNKDAPTYLPTYLSGKLMLRLVYPVVKYDAHTF